MFTGVIATSLLLALAPPLEQEPCHFTVKLEVKGSGAQEAAKSSSPSLPGTVPRRPSIEVTAGKGITIHWTVTALEKNAETLKDITIHSFVAREEELGQARRPPLDEAAVLESALFMDFSAGDSAKGTFEVSLDEPGSYLVQVETLGLAATEAHEHTAVLDVKVVPAKETPAEADGKKEAR